MKKFNTTDLCDEFIAELQVAKPIGLKDFGKKKSFYGKITTLKILDNNPLVRRILSEDGTGKVLIVDGNASPNCALMGGNIAELAYQNNWQGVIINGCIRDSLEIAEIEIGVKALFTNPQKSGKDEVGEEDVTVNFADIDFVPGHYVYADEDGIVTSEKNYGEI